MGIIFFLHDELDEARLEYDDLEKAGARFLSALGLLPAPRDAVQQRRGVDAQLASAYGGAADDLLQEVEPLLEAHVWPDH